VLRVVLLAEIAPLEQDELQLSQEIGGDAVLVHPHLVRGSFERIGTL